MRLRSFLALAIALCAACAPSAENIIGGNRVSESRSGGAAGEALVTVAATNGNPCAATWNGEPATNAQLSDRAFALVEAAVDRAGGVANITEQTLPKVRLEAAPALTFACLGPVIAAILRSGVAEIMLKPTGVTSQPVSVHGALTPSGQPAASNIIEIGPGARIAWNGEAEDLAGLRSRARAIAIPGAPPGELALIVASDVTFGAAFPQLEAVAPARPILLPPGSTLPRPGQGGSGVPPPPVPPVSR